MRVVMALLNVLSVVFPLACIVYGVYGYYNAPNKEVLWFSGVVGGAGFAWFLDELTRRAKERFVK